MLIIIIDVTVNWDMIFPRSLIHPLITSTTFRLCQSDYLYRPTLRNIALLVVLIALSAFINHPHRSYTIESNRRTTITSLRDNLFCAKCSIIIINTHDVVSRARHTWDVIDKSPLIDYTKHVPFIVIARDRYRLSTT